MTKAAFAELRMSLAKNIIPGFLEYIFLTVNISLRSNIPSLFFISWLSTRDVVENAQQVPVFAWSFTFVAGLFFSTIKSVLARWLLWWHLGSRLRLCDRYKKTTCKYRKQRNFLHTLFFKNLLQHQIYLHLLPVRRLQHCSIGPICQHFVLGPGPGQALLHRQSLRAFMGDLNNGTCRCLIV